MNDHDEITSRAGHFWAWLPALLLGSMLLGLGALAYIAIDDPSFALEPNYYDKAVRWDRTQAEARESERIGLQLSLTGPLSLNKDGGVELELRVSDRANTPLCAATVLLEAFPNAFASRVEHVTLREVSPGVYRGRLSRGTRGLWELRFDVRQGSQQFREVLRRDVTPGDAA
jgi:nitrogen fixation protein FixH